MKSISESPCRQTSWSSIIQFCLIFMVLIIGISFRGLWLENIPGINGDEAWYGLQLRASDPIAWHTPTGNILNPFHMIPLALFQWIFPDGFLALRLPALLSQLTFILAGWILLRKTVGATPALIFAIVSAGTPHLIAYSRFGWDTSHSALATMLIIYFTLEQKWKLMLLTQCFALIIHPSNIFIVPIWIIYSLWKVYPSGDKNIKYFWVALGMLMIISLLLATILMTNQNFNFIIIEKYQWFTRVLDLRVLKDLAIKFGELMSGITIYGYIVGPVSESTRNIHLSIFYFVIIPIITYGCLILAIKKDYLPIVFSTGIIAAIFCLYWVSGEPPYRFGYERYRQFLFAPFLVVFSYCLGNIPSLKKHSINIYIAIIISCAGLLSFWNNYFTPFFQTGGNSFLTFRTALIEPKKQVFEIMLEKGLLSSKNPIMVTEDWWLTMPLKYLSSKYPAVKVVGSYEVGNDNLYVQNILEKNGFVVGFIHGIFDELLQKQRFPFNVERIIIRDYSERPLIIIYHKLPP